MSEVRTREAVIEAPDAVSPRASRLGPTTAFGGELRSSEDLMIEGEFDGRIDLGDHNLVIDKNGRIKADIRAKHVTISGSVEGNIEALGRVFIAKEGAVKGDISASKVSISEGAQFRGSIRMKR